MPKQIIGAWRVVSDGLAGNSLPLGRDSLEDPHRGGGAHFPNIWLFRLMELGGTNRVIGQDGIVSLFVTLLILGYRLLRKTPADRYLSQND